MSEEQNGLKDRPNGSTDRPNGVAGTPNEFEDGPGKTVNRRQRTTAWKVEPADGVNHGLQSIQTILHTPRKSYNVRL